MRKGDEFWLDILCNTVLSLADTQLLTGVAITLASACKCSISVYHFSFVGTMAWFAIQSYSIGLSIVRVVLLKYPMMKWIRLLAFTILCALRMFLAVLSAKGWDTYYYEKVFCLDFSQPLKLNSGNSVGFLCDLLFLIQTWLSVVIALMPGWQEAVGQFSSMAYRRARRVILSSGSTLLTLPSRASKASSLGPKYGYLVFTVITIFEISILLPIYLIPFSILVAAALVIWITEEILISFWTNSFLNFVWFYLGVDGLIYERDIGKELMSNPQAENAWGFGQTAAVFLLLIPLIMMTDTLYSEY